LRNVLPQVIRIGLMAKITLKDCPGLRALLDEFETLGELTSCICYVTLSAMLNFL
jgi:hypothetical protein